MQGSNVSPQQALKTARAGLLTSLIAAAKALESDDASPGLVAQALQGVVNAQIPYNNAVVRIPLSVMTEGVLFNDMAAGPVPGDIITKEQADEMMAEADVVHQVGPPAQLFRNANPRKWADTFLAENKNRTIVREELVNWFAGAMTEGAKAALEQGVTVPPRDP